MDKWFFRHFLGAFILAMSFNCTLAEVTTTISANPNPSVNGEPVNIIIEVQSSRGGFVTSSQLDFSAGGSSTCGLRVGGQIMCWGNNLTGTLGNGTLVTPSSPVGVLDIQDATQILQAGGNACAIVTDGKVKCWGSNTYGELGIGTTGGNSTNPVYVRDLSSVARLASGGGQFMCAVLSGGAAKCWGYNNVGQLGDGTRVNSASPVQVQSITNAVQIAAGYSHACALLMTGEVKCWGHNGSGQLGDGTTQHSSVPVSVLGVQTAKAVFAGRNISCALMPDDVAKCWGNGQTQVGAAGTYNDVKYIGFGQSHECIHKTSGEFQCVGSNSYGQIGDGSVRRAEVLGVGGNHTCVGMSDGAVACWGNNVANQLGVAGLPRWTATPHFLDDTLEGEVQIFDGTRILAAQGLLDGRIRAKTNSLSVGEHALSAKFLGSSGFPASSSPTLIHVVKRQQSITWTQNLSGAIGDQISLTGSASSSLPVQYASSTNGTCTVSGATLHLIGPGNCNLTASQAGDANYAAATPVQKSFGVTKGSQTITWTQTLSGAVGGSIALTATGGASGNAVTYTGTTSICAVSGSTLNLIGAGSCTVTASQAGNANYNAATDVPKTFTVAGASLAISPPNVGFPDQPVNSTSAEISLLLTNTGTINLTVTGVSLSGVAAASFSATNGCTSVAPSSNCVVSVSFRPTSLGLKVASLIIASNAFRSPATVPLSGTGVAAAPIITVTPSAVAFADQLVGSTSASQALAIRNTGSAPISISSLVLSGPNATAFVRTGNCTTVAVNATCTTSLSFRPTVAGPASATLTINSNAYQRAATPVPLSGTGIVTTISQLAGTSDGPGFANGTGGAARFNGPTGISIDASGNLFVADSDNHVIRRITTGAVASTFAGTPLQPGAVNATGASARFNKPFGIAINGTALTVADTGNHLVRRVTSTGSVTTLAGTAGSVGSADGTASVARFSSPQGVVIDSGGNAFVADTGNQTIRRITSTGVTTTFAGSAGSAGSADGTGAAARFQSPLGITRDGSNNLYVTDPLTQTVRRITTSGVVTTFAGTNGSSGALDGSGIAASFSSPSGAVVDSNGNIFVADTANGTVRKITSAGVVTAFVGTAGSQGSANGTGAAAMFYRPVGIARDGSNNIFVADPVAHTIRRITPAGVVTTFAGLSAVVGANDNIGSLAGFRNPSGIVSDADGNLYVADTGNHTVRKVTPGGVVTTFAGTALSAGTANGTGAAARFRGPTGLAIDSAGNIYVADTGNHTIRKITAAGVVTTVAGTAGTAGSANGTGTAALFRSPSALVTTASGLLYVADAANYTIRRITLATGQVTTLAGSAGSTGTTNGTGTAARFGLVYGLGVDSAGNIFATDYSASTIRRITPAGVVTTFAGTANSRGTTNGTGTAARFSSPYGLTVDAANNIYVADYGNCLLRKITTAAAVTTPIGSAGTCKFMAGNAPGNINMPVGLTKSESTVHFTAGNGVARVVNMP